MKKFFILIVLFSAWQSFAQNPLYGITMSYQNQSGNMGKMGVFLLAANAKGTFAVKVDATANVAHFRHQTLVIPEAGLTLYPVNNGLVLPMIETEITPYTITPKAGVSIMTFIELSMGYGFDIRIKERLKPINGFTFSLGVNIPLNIF